MQCPAFHLSHEFHLSFFPFSIQVALEHHSKLVSERYIKVTSVNIVTGFRARSIEHDTPEIKEQILQLF